MSKSYKKELKIKYSAWYKSDLAAEEAMDCGISEEKKWFVDSSRTYFNK